MNDYGQGAREFLASPRAVLQDYGNDCYGITLAAQSNEQVVGDALKRLFARNNGKLLLTLAEAKPADVDKIKTKYPQESAAIDTLVTRINQLYQEQNPDILEIVRLMSEIMILIGQATKQTK